MLINISNKKKNINIQVSKRNRICAHIQKMEITLRENDIQLYLNIWRKLIVFRKYDYNRCEKI